MKYFYRSTMDTGNCTPLKMSCMTFDKIFLIVATKPCDWLKNVCVFMSIWQLFWRCDNRGIRAGANIICFLSYV